MYCTISLYSGVGTVPHMPLPSTSKTGCVQEQVFLKLMPFNPTSSPILVRSS